MNEVYAVLDSFQTLPNRSRRDLYYGIMDQLRRDEWREVKERADKESFHCDILGKLPIEIALLVTAQLNLADLLILQRVSIRWRELLSSPTVQWFTLQAVVGKDPTGQVCDRSSATRLLKKRIRMERCQPTSILRLPSPYSPAHDVPLSRSGVDYFNGMYAWLDGTDDRASVVLLNLRTGKMSRLMTENREQLSVLNISEKLIAAISTQGYCHVWDIETLEHKAFRLPSLFYKHFLISGIKILVAFDKYLVHWGFNSGLARTVNVNANIALLALDPVEDEFTVAQTYLKEDEKRFPLVSGFPLILLTKWSIISSSNDFDPWVMGYRELAFDVIPESWYLGHHRNRGQSSMYVTMLPPPYTTSDVESDDIAPALVMTASDDIAPGPVMASSDDYEACYAYFTLGPYFTFGLASGPLIDMHLSVPFPGWVGPDFPSIAFLDNNLIYACGRDNKLLISRETTYDGILFTHPVQRSIPNMPCRWVYGDKDFVVAINEDEVEIWGFDENWEFPKITAV